MPGSHKFPDHEAYHEMVMHIPAGFDWEQRSVKKLVEDHVGPRHKVGLYQLGVWDYTVYVQVEGNGPVWEATIKDGLWRSS